MSATDQTERLLVGSLILQSSWVGFAAEKLRPGDFGSWWLGQVYGLLLELDGRGETIDATTVPIHAQRVLGDRVSVSEVAELTDDVPSAAAVRTYLDEVVESAKRRRAAQALREALEALEARGGGTAAEVADAAAVALARATEGQVQGGGWRTMHEVAGDVVARVDRIAAGTEAAGGLRLGLSPLDDLLGGLHPGDVMIIGARPGMGKTALGMQIAEHVALTAGAVGVISLEMPDEQLVGRRIAARAKLSVRKLRQGLLTPDERGRLVAARLEIARMPLLIDDEAGITGERALAKLRKLWAFRPDLKLGMIDYAQLLTGEDQRQSREQQLAAISRAAKKAAKEMGIPLILLAQLNRGLETRKDRRPLVSDLRESGAFEQDADHIVFIYREEMYDRDNPDVRGVAELIVAKNRHGPTGTAIAKWVGWLTRFEAADSPTTVDGPREDPAIVAEDGTIPF